MCVCFSHCSTMAWFHLDGILFWGRCCELYLNYFLWFMYVCVFFFWLCGLVLASMQFGECVCVPCECECVCSVHCVCMHSVCVCSCVCEIGRAACRERV